MFKAIHGSASDIAGKGIANPSGLIQAAIQLLNFMDLSDTAKMIENAWKTTIEEGYHTADIYNPHISKKENVN
jgi:isocitrate dehydrogenase